MSFDRKRKDDMRKRESRKDNDFRRNDETENAEIIYGRNAVIEALKAGTPINKILMTESKGGSLGVITSIAREKGVVFTCVTKEKIEELCGSQNHQGVMAYVAAAQYYDIDDILAKAESLGEQPFIIILDEIQDAHNLGAIIRSADAVGAHGVIIPKRRAASLTGVVAKTSAGAISHVLVARVPNIPMAVDELKEKGLWIAGTDLTGETTFYDADFKGAIGLVIGSEGNGMGRLVREKCDYILNIPMKGAVSSLNASVAAGVVMYEVFRQRRG